MWDIWLLAAYEKIAFQKLYQKIVFMILNSEKVIKEMFSDKINGHRSLEKLYYFPFGSVRFYVICAMFYL